MPIETPVLARAGSQHDLPGGKNSAGRQRTVHLSVVMGHFWRAKYGHFSRVPKPTPFPRTPRASMPRYHRIIRRRALSRRQQVNLQTSTGPKSNFQKQFDPRRTVRPNVNRESTVLDGQSIGNDHRVRSTAWHGNREDL